MRPGGKVIYTIRVTSRGPETARNLRICDLLPRGMQAVRAPGGTIRGQRVCWRRAKAKVGRHLRYQVQARATLAGPPVRVNPVAVAGANFARARRGGAGAGHRRAARLRIRGGRPGRARGLLIRSRTRARAGRARAATGRAGPRARRRAPARAA